MNIRMMTVFYHTFSIHNHFLSPFVSLEKISRTFKFLAVRLLAIGE